jgi:hypothetical protein
MVSIALLRNPRSVVLSHLQQLEEQLQGQRSLFGAESNHADFSTFHGLWFLRDLGEPALAEGFANVNAWMDRLLAVGDGPHTETEGEEALQTAAAATPLNIAARHRTYPMISRHVGIQPSDYAQDKSTGLPVGATPTEWILAREVDAVGRVNVHFPKAGFGLVGLKLGDQVSRCGNGEGVLRRRAEAAITAVSGASNRSACRHGEGEGKTHLSADAKTNDSQIETSSWAP